MLQDLRKVVVEGWIFNPMHEYFCAGCSGDKRGRDYDMNCIVFLGIERDIDHVCGISKLNL